jgi:hypothetical protein
MTATFHEIRTDALGQLPADTGLDGEPVVWKHDRLASARLRQHLARRASGRRAAWPST